MYNTAMNKTNYPEVSYDSYGRTLFIDEKKIDCFLLGDFKVLPVYDNKGLFDFFRKKEATQYMVAYEKHCDINPIWYGSKEDCKYFVLKIHKFLYNTQKVDLDLI